MPGRMHTQNVNFQRVFIAGFEEDKTFILFLASQCASTLLSAFLSHIPLLPLFNWGSFLYGLNFYKAINKASG